MPLDRTWMLDARRFGVGWRWCCRASKFLGRRRRKMAKGGISMLLPTSPSKIICKTSPSKMICKSGTTHSVPYPLAESVSLAGTWLCNWIHTSPTFLLGKYFTGVKNMTLAKLLLHWPKAPDIPRAFDVTILMTWTWTSQANPKVYVLRSRCGATQHVHKPTNPGQYFQTEWSIVFLVSTFFRVCIATIFTIFGTYQRWLVSIP